MSKIMRHPTSFLSPNHAATNWMSKLPPGHAEASLIRQTGVYPEASCQGGQQGWVCQWAWWSPNLPLTFTPTQSAYGLCFFLLRCFLERKQWGSENFCACGCNEFSDWAFSRAVILRLSCAKKAIWEACRNSFLGPIPSDSDSIDLGGDRGWACLRGSHMAPEKHTENHCSRRGPGGEGGTMPPGLFGFCVSLMYPICQTHPYATTSMILVAVSLKGSVGANGLQLKPMSTRSRNIFFGFRNNNP